MHDIFVKEITNHNHSLAQNKLDLIDLSLVQVIIYLLSSLYLQRLDNDLLVTSADKRNIFVKKCDKLHFTFVPTVYCYKCQ